MNYTGNDLTIVLCAYKECSYLEKSLRAVINQTVKCNVVISTSTPNDYISKIAEKYQVPVLVNPNGGHVKDYNFALSQIRTKLGMIAHQDDLLSRKFVEKSLKGLNAASNPILSFSDYLEIHNDIPDSRPSTMVWIKRILVWPMCIPFFRRTVLAKRLGQCMGNPITHPTVICVMKRLPDPPFRIQYQASMDWDLWERLSREKGEYVYINRVLLHHRMTADNATAKLIRSTNARYSEEYEILSRFWPKPIAGLIMKFYSMSAKYY